ncbi:MAG: recombinase RecA [Myxococcales bacterium]|nr:recombinase RecA [Myxococcales bacterium]
MRKQASGAVKEVIGQIEKRFGKGAIMALDDDHPDEPIAVVPSGSLVLDQALGVGGYPRGRIIEIFGPESSGKTTLSLHAIAEAQRLGGVAAFIDAEHAFDPTYARALGVSTAELLLAQPDSGEQALEIAETLTRSGAVDLIVIDSVAALTPQAEIDGEMGDAHMGLQARLMSQALRKLTPIAHKTSTALVFINQLRQKIGVVFGNPETTPGGQALKFYASVRLDVRRIGQVKASDQAVGARTRVKVIKNKCAAPFREAEFEIRWGHGIDAASEILDRGIELGVIDKSGAFLSFAGEQLGQGRERARETLLAGGALAEAIRAEIAAAGGTAVRTAVTAEA